MIDLEGKLYTKIPFYIKEVEDAYLNFVKYHNDWNVNIKVLILLSQDYSQFKFNE